VFVDELRKPQRASHSGRPAADNDYISRHLRASYVGRRLAKNKHKNVATDFRGLNRIKLISASGEIRVIRG